MGRANVYLPDDLERRVKAARIPVSEVCQQALLAAVEAAESAGPRLGDAVAAAYRQGAQAGEQWGRAASPVTLLTLLRDQRLDQIPTDHLPESWYSLSDELTTAWEAGFVEAARGVARAAVDVAPGSDAAPDSPPDAAPSAAPNAARRHVHERPRGRSDPLVEELVITESPLAGRRFHQLHRAGPCRPARRLRSACGGRGGQEPAVRGPRAGGPACAAGAERRPGRGLAGRRRRSARRVRAVDPARQRPGEDREASVRTTALDAEPRRPARRLRGWRARAVGPARGPVGSRGRPVPHGGRARPAGSSRRGTSPCCR